MNELRLVDDKAAKEEQQYAEKLLDSRFTYFLGIFLRASLRRLDLWEEKRDSERTD